MRSKQLKKVLILKFLFLIAGCGVKGDPLPPTTPPQIGRGQPTFKRATEKIPLQNYSPKEDEEKEEKEPEDE
jgi:hypothetical protein